MKAMSGKSSPVQKSIPLPEFNFDSDCFSFGILSF